jgi:hypothetical protein
MHKSFAKQVLEWRLFYRRVCGVSFRPESVTAPKERCGFSRMIVVAKGVTPDGMFALCAKRFPASRHVTRLDECVPARDRTPAAPYAVCVRDSAEPDRDLGGLSALDLLKKQVPAITLLERLLFELKFFSETGRHLDQKDITLCAGSRYPDGRVPVTIFGRGEFTIHWCSENDRYPRLRAREVLV